MYTRQRIPYSRANQLVSNKKVNYGTIVNPSYKQLTSLNVETDHMNYVNTTLRNDHPLFTSRPNIKIYGSIEPKTPNNIYDLKKMNKQITKSINEFGP